MAEESCCHPSSPARGTRGAVGASTRSTSSGPPAVAPPNDLEWRTVPAGTFQMGTDDAAGYPADGEGPQHDVQLEEFTLAAHAVTNAQFAAFATATAYRTTAENEGSSFVFGGLLPDDFPETQGVAAAPWWRLVDGADWSHPEGPQSDVDARGDHPVVHVSWYDATAYCAWSGTRLPTEAEWERGARGGREGAHFPWGDEREPAGVHRMNVFQGVFPGQDTGADGWVGTCPVGAFPPNDFGLYEMTGNVWEWCADWYAADYYRGTSRHSPSGPETGAGRVTRGGSYLCHDSYCWRYRVDSRSSSTPSSSTGNVGFRAAGITRGG